MFTYGMGQRLTGIGRYARELSYALRALEAGLEIHLLNPYPDSPLDWYRDFPTHPLPSLKRLPAVVTLGSMVLERVARTLRLDVLHDPCGIAPFLAPRSHTRRVVTVHDAIPYIHPELQPVLTRLVFETLVRAARWTADAVITDSRSARDDLLRYASLDPTRVHATPLGVSLPSDDEILAWQKGFSGVRWSRPVRTPYVLYVGDFNPRKNVPRLLEAFRRVRSGRPFCELVLVGPDTPAARSILSLATGSDMGVSFLGYVDELSLHVLYANASAVVIPSLYEGFGLPVLEAMAHGAPIVASDRSSFPEVVGNAGLLVDPEDTEGLAKAMGDVLADRDLRIGLADAGRERARRFTWESTARQTMTVYEQVLAA